MEVDADIEPAVIPVGFMVPAPLASCVHLGDVIGNLMALLAVALNVAVDSRPIRFQPAVAIFAPVSIGANGAAKS
jgi:hypothetical protein